jgi:hypothetical protein
VSKGYKVEGITYSVPKWNNGLREKHGYPIFNKVKDVQSELKEKELREQHSDLAKAYEEYTILLKKYGFWDKITK